MSADDRAERRLAVLGGNLDEWMMLWLFREGHSVAEIAARSGGTPRSVMMFLTRVLRLDISGAMGA